MKTKSPRLLAGLALFCIGTPLVPACDTEPDETFADAGTDSLDEQVMLRLGNPDLDGPLVLLENEFEVIEEVEAYLDEDILDGVQVLGISLAEADHDQAEGWLRLAEAAMDRDVKIVLEGATGQQMAKSLGFGLDASAVAVTRAPGGKHLLTVLPDERSRFADPELDFSAGPNDGDLESPERVPTTAEDFLDELGDMLHAEDPGFRSEEVEGYRYYFVNMVAAAKFMDLPQLVVSDVDFEAELALDVARNRKVLQLKPRGPGVHPGLMSSDSRYNRGHFIENVRLEFYPIHNANDIELYAHAPTSDSSATTYVSSTGWSVGFKGTEPTVTYNYADQESTTLPDFTVENQTAGKHAAWDIGLTSKWSDMYEYPTLQRCRVKGIPTVAKTALVPKAEAIYRTMDTYNGTVGLRMYMLVSMYKLTAGGYPSCKKSAYDKYVNRSLDIYVDFSEVSISTPTQ